MQTASQIVIVSTEETSKGRWRNSRHTGRPRINARFKLVGEETIQWMELVASGPLPRSGQAYSAQFAQLPDARGKLQTVIAELAAPDFEALNQKVFTAVEKKLGEALEQARALPEGIEEDAFAQLAELFADFADKVQGIPEERQAKAQAILAATQRASIEAMDEAQLEAEFEKASFLLEAERQKSHPSAVILKRYQMKLDKALAALERLETLKEATAETSQIEAPEKAAQETQSEELEA